MMKKILLVVLVIGGIGYFISCDKSSPSGGYFSCKDAPVSYDTAALENYARSNNIQVVQDTSGLLYQIVSPGTGGSYPNLGSTIFVTYTASTLDGTIFDSTSNPAKTGFILSNLIKAWQIGIPKIQAGGHIKLLCPSSLAYGCQGAGTFIPPNTPVFFDVNLVSFQ